MAKKMLIDATHAEETRVVVVDGNKVDEFDFETVNKRQLAGNIYLAKVTRVEPSLQAAFVDYGGNRHGFLAFSEIHPDYYQIPVADREALLAEEREMNRDEEEDGAEEPRKKTRSRRSRSRSRKEDKGENAASEARSDGIEGMDIVDLDPAPEEPDALGEPVGVIEDGETPPVEEAPAVEAEPAEAETPEAGGEDSTGPGRTMAARQEDDPADVITSEPVEPDGQADAEETSEAVVSEGEAAALPAEEAEAPAPEKPKRRRTRRSKAATEAEAEAEAEAKAPEAESAPESATDSDEGAEEEDHLGHDIESVAEEDVQEEIRRPRKPRMRRYKIQEVVKVRQIMLVQVVKEERGNKGAALTTYLSLAGRYCVLMPNTARGGGISRKITNASDRKKLKEIAGDIKVPEGAGLIIRTAGARRTKAEIKRDYEYLKRLWEQIRELTLKSVAPAPIYEEGNLIKRSIRDLYNRDIDEVFVEGDEGYRTAKDFMKMIMPSHARNVKHYTDPMPLFARYQVEGYLAGMFNPTVQLKSGGYIVIGVTEALVAIDVNSGRATKEGSIEETATKTNLEAADEIARQLRLRDLAGLIVIDFIDMDERKNNSAVEKRLKDRLKTDRARIQVGKISGFGLLEMSRQRLRPGMLESTTQPCPHCHGTGLIRSDDSLALTILRAIEEEGTRKRTREVLVKAPVAVANFLMNGKREHIALIEARYGMSVRVEGDPILISPDFAIEKFKTATRAVPEIASPVVSVDAQLMAQIDDDELPEVEEDEEDEREDGVSSTRAEGEDGEGSGRSKRRRRRRRRGGKDRAEGFDGTEENGAETAEESDAVAEDAVEGSEAAPSEAEVEEKPKSRSRSRSRSRRKPEAEAASGEAEPASKAGTEIVDLRDLPATPAEPVKAEQPAAAEPDPVEAADNAAAAEEEVQIIAAETAAETAASAEAPGAEAVADPVAVTESASEPEAGPARPKRRGWWSIG
ncbi:MAG: Rne/Rng family ribonuclease [Tropicimonas sp.]|uniref:Rne/Rng family ribonuclease n=1 Tax=Tropicimonas sp. TaxID=2067044 RepID=UPI003A8A7F7D